MNTRTVKYEVAVRLDGNGSAAQIWIGLPEIVREAIKEAILSSEGEGTLSGEQTTASAHLESVTLMRSDTEAMVVESSDR